MFYKQENRFKWRALFKFSQRKPRFEVRSVQHQSPVPFFRLFPKECKSFYWAVSGSPTGPVSKLSLSVSYFSTYANRLIRKEHKIETEKRKWVYKGGCMWGGILNLIEVARRLKKKKNWNPLSTHLLMTCHKLVQAASATRAPGCLASFPWSKTDKHIPLRPDVAGRARSQLISRHRGSGEVCASFLIVTWSYYERSRKWDFWGMLQWNSGSSCMHFPITLLALATQK